MMNLWRAFWVGVYHAAAESAADQMVEKPDGPEHMQLRIKFMRYMDKADDLMDLMS